ncbi:hypothetical protein LPJGGPFB_02734 [Ensifer adhaerens]|nr:hypothetical protein [Ensifer adhaerens]
MRDANFERFLRYPTSPATERGADGAAIRTSLGRRGRCAKVDRCIRRDSAFVVIRASCDVPTLLGEILAGLASPARPDAVVARFDRFVWRRLPQGRADCPVRAALAVTVEV